ncbi:MAG: hypothetical protein LBJ00_02880 [Planctomycetaceae bacterium]|nr:hypothetical protein [Planctomycetaceae bacterium]
MKRLFKGEAYRLTGYGIPASVYAFAKDKHREGEKGEEGYLKTFVRFCRHCRTLKLFKIPEAGYASVTT